MMKYAEEIVKEIEERSPIDTTSCIVDKDDAWEDYIRGKEVRQEKKRNHVSIMKMVVKNVLSVLACIIKQKVRDKE